VADTPQTPAPDTLLGIADGLDLVLISADEVLVQFGTRSHPSELLRDGDLRGTLAAIAGRLTNGPATLAELLSRVREEVRDEARDVITDLLQRGILTDVRRSPVAQYLGYTLTGETTLAARSVSLIGAGPTGGRVAHSLMQHGLSRVTLLDDRPADRLWHQYAPFGPAPDHRPGAKAQHALRDQLRAAGHRGVETLDAPLDPDGVGVAARESDLVILALEQPDLRLAHVVNRVCIRAGMPWLLATMDGNVGLVGPLFIPGHTACYNDFRALADAATPSPEMARRHQQHILERGAGSFFPGLPAYADIVAGHTALAAVSFLLRGTSFALGRVLVINFDRMLIDVEDILRLPRCPVCGTERRSYRSPSSVDVLAQR